MVSLVFLLLGILVVLGVVLVLSRRVDPGLSPDDRPAAPELPSGPMTADDLDQVRFRVGLRGYRMEDVDAVIARMAEELRRRDA